MRTSRGAVVSSGAWVYSGSESQDTYSSDSYSGSGSYSYAVRGGSVSGILGEVGGNGYSRNRSLSATMASNGSWTRTGSGGGGTSWFRIFDYSGSGTYSYSVTGGSVSGMITESYSGSWTRKPVSERPGHVGWMTTSVRLPTAARQPRTWPLHRLPAPRGSRR